MFAAVRWQMFGEQVGRVFFPRDLSVTHLFAGRQLLHPKMPNANVPQLAIAPPGRYGKCSRRIYEYGCREAHAPAGAELGETNCLASGL